MKKKLAALLTFIMVFVMMAMPVAAADGPSGDAGDYFSGIVATGDGFAIFGYKSATMTEISYSITVTENSNSPLTTSFANAVKEMKKISDTPNVNSWYLTRTLQASSYGLTKDQMATIMGMSSDEPYIQFYNEVDVMYSGWTSISNIHSAVAVDATVSTKNVDAVTALLKKEGVTEFLQVTTAQKGAFPGIVSFSASLKAEDMPNVKEDSAYSKVYYYDAAAEKFERVNSYVSAYKYEEYGSFYMSRITKGGTYVLVAEELPKALVSKEAKPVSSSSSTSAGLASDVKNAIDSAEKGDILKVEVKSGLSVKSDVFKEASEKGVGLEFVSTAGTPVTWSFATIGAAVDFDPTVNVGEASEKVDKVAAEYVKENTGMKYTNVSFAYDGNLPGEAEVQLDLSESGFTEGQEVYLYYYNPTTGKLEIVDSAKYVDGFATFTMTHCSEYIVTDTKLVTEDKTDKTPVKTGDTPIAAMVIIMIAGCALVGAAVLRKRIAK